MHKEFRVSAALALAKTPLQILTRQHVHVISSALLESHIFLSFHKNMSSMSSGLLEIILTHIFVARLPFC
jgi:hypothetical protein